MANSFRGSTFLHDTRSHSVNRRHDRRDA